MGVVVVETEVALLWPSVVDLPIGAA